MASTPSPSGPAPSSPSLAAAAPAVAKRAAPADFLRAVVGRPVSVRLVSGVDYRGILVCLDSFMNIALEQTEEFVGGTLRNKYGDTMIRGSNVLYISSSPSGPAGAQSRKRPVA